MPPEAKSQGSRRYGIPDQHEGDPALAGQARHLRQILPHVGPFDSLEALRRHQHLVAHGDADAARPNIQREDAPSLCRFLRFHGFDFIIGRSMLH